MLPRPSRRFGILGCVGGVLRRREGWTSRNQRRRPHLSHARPSCSGAHDRRHRRRHRARTSPRLSTRPSGAGSPARAYPHTLGEPRAASVTPPPPGRCRALAPSAASSRRGKTTSRAGHASYYPLATAETDTGVVGHTVARFHKGRGSSRAVGFVNAAVTALHCSSTRTDIGCERRRHTLLGRRDDFNVESAPTTEEPVRMADRACCGWGRGAT